MSAVRYILGSRSPRRLELLRLLVPGEQIVVKPPRSSEEADFEGLTDRAALERRLAEIVEVKRRDVAAQLSAAERAESVALVADTIIVASAANGVPVVLGQPPETGWESVVRHWFAEFYSGRTHEAWTRVCVWNESRILLEDMVTTSVTFRELTPAEIAWYVSTGESRGKAGGYALQGLASTFVSRVEGSLSNVVGLPLELLRLVLPM